MWYDGNKVIIIKLIVVVVGSFCFQGMFSDCIKVIIIKQFKTAHKINKGESFSKMPGNLVFFECMLQWFQYYHKMSNLL